MNDNKLIAEFMGIIPIETWYEDTKMLLPQHIYDAAGGNGFDMNELLFDKSWDWLMPVVEKIEKLMTNSYIPNYNETKGYSYWLDKFKVKFWDINILYVYVIEFIKWHNQQKK